MNRPTNISRRTALAQLGTSAAALWASAQATAAEKPPACKLGLVIYDCDRRRRLLRERDPNADLFEPLTFLKHCHAVGASGMQADLGVLPAAQVRALRDYAAQHGLFIDAIVSPPKADDDVARFEAQIRTAAEVGVQAARTVIMPGRRYEIFKSLAEFRDFAERGRLALERARPIVEKHRVRLGVENHKDQRLDERLALYKQLNSDYIGACVDTGNSFALLDDPYGTVEALAPYAFTVHLKNQAVLASDNGFYLGDVPLGDGSFDIKRMVDTLRKAKPKLCFVLELITRDPLSVPCLTDDYFTTMPTVSGRDLARTLRIVQQHPSKNLQQVSKLPLAKQVEFEDANVAASLRYAREHLDF
jgi:sugar phosphate isomerase/epimerase